MRHAAEPIVACLQKTRGEERIQYTCRRGGYYEEKSQKIRGTGRTMKGREGKGGQRKARGCDEDTRVDGAECILEIKSSSLSFPSLGGALPRLRCKPRLWASVARCTLQQAGQRRVRASEQGCLRLREGRERKRETEERQRQERRDSSTSLVWSIQFFLNVYF